MAVLVERSRRAIYELALRVTGGATGAEVREDYADVVRGIAAFRAEPRLTT